MEIEFTTNAGKDLAKLKKSGLSSTRKRLERILDSILETPYEGFASPEELKHEYAGYWSRELSKKDRVVYRVDEQKNIIYIYSLLGHYTDK
jgi:toxin YoeB